MFIFLHKYKSKQYFNMCWVILVSQFNYRHKSMSFSFCKNQSPASVQSYIWYWKCIKSCLDIIPGLSVDIGHSRAPSFVGRAPSCGGGHMPLTLLSQYPFEWWRHQIRITHCVPVLYFHFLCLCGHPPYLSARHPTFKFRGEKEWTYPGIEGENQPVERADGRWLPASR